MFLIISIWKFFYMTSTADMCNPVYSSLASPFTLRDVPILTSPTGNDASCHTWPTQPVSHNVDLPVVFPKGYQCMRTKIPSLSTHKYDIVFFISCTSVDIPFIYSLVRLSRNSGEKFDAIIFETIQNNVIAPGNKNKRPMGHIAHLKNQFKSINTYD